MKPIVIGYQPGSCGVRLAKKLINSQIWNHYPKAHQHYGASTLIKWSGYHKYPKSTDIDNLSPIKIEQSIILMHSLHGQTLSKLFPERQIVKIQTSFYKSMRRWWYVFGKQWYQKLSPPPDLYFRALDKHLTCCQQGIAFHAEYYETNVDTTADYCWKIEPGQSDFADFVLQEFDCDYDSEFDDAWHYVKEISNFSVMKTDMLICSE